MTQHTTNYAIAIWMPLSMIHAYGTSSSLSEEVISLYITISRTINAVEYMIQYYDFNISKHNTEYKYSTATNEGSTSIDVSDFPIHTPSICKSVYYYLLLRSKRL